MSQEVTTSLAITKEEGLLILEEGLLEVDEVQVVVGDKMH